MAQLTQDDMKTGDSIAEFEDVSKDEKVDRNPETNRLAYAQNVSEEEFAAIEKKLKWKLDIRLLAYMWLIFVLNYLDRNNIAAAKVAGIAKSLKLSDTQYATAVALLFVGYVLMQIPSNIFLAQIRPSIYIRCVMALWGLISALTGVILLGFVEAAFYPGALFLISSWYKRQELGVRNAILFSATQLGSAFSGLIEAGIQDSLDGARGKASWRWMLIIEGYITVFVAITAVLILPDWPSTTRWLTPQERAVAEWRLVKDAGQVDEDNAQWSHGFKLAFTDWRLYVLAFGFLYIQVASATSNFFPTVVGTLGYNRVNTLLLTVPPYIWMLCCLNTGARYFAMVLMIAGGHGSNAVLLAWLQKTMVRPRIKRASAVAFVNAMGNTSQVWTAYLYISNTSPRYTLAIFVNSVFALLVILTILFIRVILRRANKKLESSQASVTEILKRESEAAITSITEEERIARKERFCFII
ncbi:major facilitator superfamily domain-containing protein [Tricladium varicosporioides]|nr:major facilitator superfamily domain-containing protein [Hymenoscyphus varicosporioides]